MQYKNISAHQLTLIGHGIVKAGSIMEAEVEIENPNLELVVEQPTPLSPASDTTPPEQPNN